MGCGGSKDSGSSADDKVADGLVAAAAAGKGMEDGARRRSIAHKAKEFDDGASEDVQPFDIAVIGTLTRHGIAPARSAGIMSKAKINQDRGLITWPFNGSYNQALVCVFDGHGINGERISDWCVEQITGRLEANRTELLQNTPKWMTSIVVEMDRALLSHPQLGGCARSAGTTSNVLYFRGPDLFVGCSGDSRAVLGRRRKGLVEAYDLSRDHKPDLPEEKKRIERAGGYVSAAGPKGLPPSRVWVQGRVGLAMSRSLGDGEAKDHGVIPDPEVSHTRLVPCEEGSTADGDLFVIVASDGIWEFITSQQACEIVMEHCHATNACEALVKTAERRWQEEEGTYRDDITCIVLMLPFLQKDGKDAEEAGGAGGGASAALGDVNLATKSDAVGAQPVRRDSEAMDEEGANAVDFAKRRLSMTAPLDYDQLSQGLAA